VARRASPQFLVDTVAHAAFNRLMDIHLQRLSPPRGTASSSALRNASGLRTLVRLEIFSSLPGHTPANVLAATAASLLAGTTNFTQSGHQLALTSHRGIIGLTTTYYSVVNRARYWPHLQSSLCTGNKHQPPADHVPWTATAPLSFFYPKTET
jgi:hypothetical protein